MNRSLKPLSIKYFYFLFGVLLLLFGVLSLVGCEPDNPTPSVPKLEIAQDLTSEAFVSLTLQFDAEAGNNSFAVLCDRAWTATSSSADWCVVTPAEGDGDKMVTVAVSKNAGAARRAEIIISALQSQRTVCVEQSGGQPADPSDPSDPTDPTDPSDPTDPEDPSDPDDPADPENPLVPADPIVYTTEASDITVSGATLGGSYEFEGTVAEAGVAYRVAGATDYIIVISAAIQTPFTVTLNALNAATSYEYYAYVVVGGKEYKGEVRTFATAQEASTAVTYFADDFSSVENNKVYTSSKWTFTSTDAGWPANAYMGWFGKNNEAEQYINVAPYNSQLSEVVAYAVMTQLNVADAQSKQLTFDLAWHFKTKDNSKFEVVASKNYAGDVTAATWEVVGSYSYTDENITPINIWSTYSLDLSTKYAGEKALTVAFRYTGKSNTYRLDNVKFGAVEIPTEDEDSE